MMIIGTELCLSPPPLTPLKSYTEALAPTGTVSGDRAYEEIIKVK